MAEHMFQTLLLNILFNCDFFLQRYNYYFSKKYITKNKMYKCFLTISYFKILTLLSLIITYFYVITNLVVLWNFKISVYYLEVCHKLLI